MYTFTSKNNLKKHLNTLSNEETIGFVPTMGALHEGHLELIRRSKSKCSITICSIFVNPTQFNSPSDLKNYPNTINSDLKKLKKLGCDILYAPKTHDLYKKEEKAKKFDFGSLTNIMEGEFRPGHFCGVATVIEKLFNIIHPKIAFFGEKDLQQLQVVKALVKKMNSKILIEGVETIREKNGLAKSSRNKLLDNNAKNEAALIYNYLKYCKKNKHQGIFILKEYIINQFQQNKNLKLEYVEIVAVKNMQRIKEWEEKNKSAICISAYHSGVRLIDNIIL